MADPPSVPLCFHINTAAGADFDIQLGNSVDTTLIHALSAIAAITGNAPVCMQLFEKEGEEPLPRNALMQKVAQDQEPRTLFLLLRDAPAACAAVGDGLTLVTSSSGNIYSKGSSAHLQGHATETGDAQATDEATHEFRPIAALTGVYVVAVAVGCYHGSAVSDDGAVS